jgi:outer membrane protein TolC
MKFGKIIRYLWGLGWLVSLGARAQGPSAPVSTGPQDRDLSFYQQQAKVNSPLLKDYHNQARSNQLDSARIKAGYGPQVTGVSTNLYAPTIKGWGYDEAISNGTNLSELVTFTQKLVGKGNIQAQYDQLNLANQALDLSGKITEQDLNRTVTALYITAYGSYQQYQFDQDVLNLLQGEEKILQELTEKGVYRQTDYLTFRVTLQQQALDVAQAKMQYQNDYATLNYNCGLQDTAFNSISEPVLDPVTWLDPVSTVYYRQFQVDSLVIRNNDALIDYGYKAKVSLYADAGYESSLALDPYKNFGASVGINVTVPIYDGKQRKMQHGKVALSELTRQNYRDYFTTQYHQQVAQLLQQLHSTQGLIDQAGEQSRYTKALIEANRKLLATGDVKIADYIIALGNYMNTQHMITLNTVNKWQIINQINYWNRK